MTDCYKIVKVFKSKWPTGFNIHKEYLTCFQCNVVRTTEHRRNLETVLNAMNCTLLTKSFPSQTPLLTQKFTTKVLAEINSVCEDGTSFRGAIVMNKSNQKRTSMSTERKKDTKAVYSSCKQTLYRNECAL